MKTKKEILRMTKKQLINYKWNEDLDENKDNNFNCKDCINCINCRNCLSCRNLKNKSYCICNVQLTKKEYDKKIDELKKDALK